MMSETAIGKNGLGSRFWIPLLLTSLLSVGMGSWALFERGANMRIFSQVSENKEDVLITRERNVIQDQQILLIWRDIQEVQKSNADILRLLKSHLNIPQ